MAGPGRLPGVGLLQKKHHTHNRSYNQHHSNTTYRDSYLRESLESPWISQGVLLDETALKARQSLQKKLGHYFSSSRLSENGKKEGRAGIEKEEVGKGIGRKLLERSWIMRGNKLKKERKVCAVCLEGLHQEEQQVMKLSCSHKYHSACLLPWLVAHPHCPYCRNPVILS